MRGLVAWFFVLLIPSAHFHCVMDHGRQLRADFQHQVHATIPFEDQANGCENESACLCKGATLASPVRWDVDLDHYPFKGKLPADSILHELFLGRLLQPPQLGGPNRDSCADSPSARSGRERRILWETFLL